MPRSITISPYALRIMDTSDGSSRRLDRLPGNIDLIQLLDAYLSLRVHEKSVNNRTEHALKVLLHERRSAHSIDGILQAGAFGYGAEIEHLSNARRRFRRTIEDCEYLPFYLLLSTRPGHNEALLILQRYGIFGTKSILRDDLATYIEEALPDSRLSINPIISDEYLNDIIGGQIKSLTCIRYNVPQDIADDLGLEDHEEDAASIEMKIKAKRDHFLDIPGWMRDVVHGWQRQGRMIEVNGVEYNDVKLQIDVGGGKLKTIKLSDLRNVRMRIDISEELLIGSDGHPTIDSLRRVVPEYASGFASAIGWRR
jgi:hypothetical protein